MSSEKSGIVFILIFQGPVQFFSFDNSTLRIIYDVFQALKNAKILVYIFLIGFTPIFKYTIHFPIRISATIITFCSSVIVGGEIVGWGEPLSAYSLGNIFLM